MDRHGVQINKTSRNTVLFMTNIGTTRSSVAYLIEVLVKIARELDEPLSDMSLAERAAHERAVLRLTARSPRCPTSARSTPRSATARPMPTDPEGDVRRRSTCPTTTPVRIPHRRTGRRKARRRVDVVSATFVTPYPPGFPVLVPGQLFSREILSYMRNLDTSEMHGYSPDFGYRVYTDKALEIAAGNNHAGR